MKKKYFIFGLTLFLTISQLAIAQLLQIDSTSSTGACSNVLGMGILYCFTVSGTYNANSAIEVDAEWYFNSDYPNEPWVEYAPDHPDVPNQDILDVVVNDQALDWLGSEDNVNWLPHTFSPNHVYKYYFVGNGESVHFYISDWTPFGQSLYSDNSGSLIVEISEIPEPATMLLLTLGGLVLRRRK